MPDGGMRMISVQTQSIARFSDFHAARGFFPLDLLQERRQDLAVASSSPRNPVRSVFPAARLQDPKRHAWLSTFETAPEQGIADLLAGYADIGPLSRLNPPEAAHRLFAGLSADDPARLSLGPAVQAWLDRRRRLVPPDEAPARQRWIAELQDAFAIVHLLALTGPAVAVRRDLATWNIAVADLTVSASRDARAGLWWMLAFTQPLVAQAAPEIDPLGLVPHWLWICENAGGSLPTHYLDIGLMGLRRLPDLPTASPIPWMTGLALWADAQRPTEAMFRTQWLATKTQYPRTPSFWKECVAEVLADPLFQEKGISAPAWWSCDSDLW